MYILMICIRGIWLKVVMKCENSCIQRYRVKTTNRIQCMKNKTKLQTFDQRSNNINIATFEESQVN